MLLLSLSDTAATSQDGPSLEFIAAIAGRRCYIQDASGRGLWLRYALPPLPLRHRQAKTVSNNTHNH